MSKNLTDVFAENQIPPRYWDETASDIKVLFLELIGEDEPDEPRDAYSTTAIIKDHKNSLRKELREAVEAL